MTKFTKRFFVWCAIVICAVIVLLLARLGVAHCRVSEATKLSHGGDVASDRSSAKSSVKIEIQSGLRGAAPSSLSTATDGLKIPPAGLPLSVVAQDLKTLSDRGDVRASCRLANDLNRCKYFSALPKQRTKLMSEMQQMTPGSEDHQRLSLVISDISEKERAEAAVCQGFQNSEQLSSWLYMYRAAAAGHEQSMLNFATSPPFDIDTLLRQPEALVAYYELSETFLQQLANHGNRIALMAIVNKRLGRTFWSELGVQTGQSTDYKQAAIYAYAGLAHKWQPEVFERKISMLAEHLSASELAASAIAAKKLVGTWSEDVFNEAKYESAGKRFDSCD